MASSRILGIVLLVVGIILVGFGINSSHAPVEQLSQTFFGRYTQDTMMYLIGGAIMAVAGALIALSGGRRA